MTTLQIIRRTHTIAKLLHHAAHKRLKLTTANLMGELVRVRCPITDQPIYVPRDRVLPDHVPCD